MQRELGKRPIAATKHPQCIHVRGFVPLRRGYRLADIPHAHHDLTVSAMHAHRDHDHCLETVILKGPTEAVQRLSDTIRAERGVHHGRLDLISVELHQPHRHGKADKRGAASKKVHAADAAPHFHVKPSH
jgi:CopG family nickel-responsive transcriptional regulator